MSTTTAHLTGIDIAAAPAAHAATHAEPRDWTPLQRVAFRFAFAYLVLYNLMFPLVVYTTRGDTAAQWYPRLWEPLVAWVGASVLGMENPIVVMPTASSDTRFDYVLLLCYLVISVVAAAVWTAVDRRRRRYPGAYDALHTWVRYSVACVMVMYGAIKVIQVQFAEPGIVEALQPLGQMRAQRLMWTFMGASYAYNLFAGLGEMIGGLLLFWRRTTTLGAAILVGVMANVVVMNFAYDVPAKLFSAHLLLMPLLLLAPQARRLANFFVFNRPVAPRQLGRFADGRWRAARAVVKPLVIALAVVFPFAYNWDAPKRRAEWKNTPMYGVWRVESFARNGSVLPAGLVERGQWRRVAFPYPSAMVVTTMADSMLGFVVNVDTAAGRMELSRRSRPGVSHPLQLVRAAPGVVQVQGALDGDVLSMRLRRMDDTTVMRWRRPFRWVTDPIPMAQRPLSPNSRGRPAPPTRAQ